MQSAIQAAGDIVPGAGNNLPRGTNATQFVINLSASTSPMGLTPPTLPELKRFKFFVSRRREDGRERFRLHMGYFNSQEAAEKLLDLVREIYPAAWAGVAPGQRLHAPVPDVAPPPLVAGPVAVSTLPIPETAPAATVAASAPAVPATAAAERPFVLSLVEEPPVVRSGASGSGTPRKIDATQSPTLLALPVLAAAKRDEAANSAASQSLDSVRAAIASLDEGKPPLSAAPRAATPRPPAPHSPAARAPLPRPAAAQAAAPSPPVEQKSLSASQTLRVLEQGAPAAGSARTMARAEPTLFAVQLHWSVQPIDQSKIPPLAIFSAYTLYGAEGNRDGRRWYGLRLGFFTDTVSAQQVANYVRSEFKAVSVVPVSIRERERASGAMPRPKENSAPNAAAPAALVAPSAGSHTGEFKLLDDRAIAAAVAATAPAPVPTPSKAAAGSAPRRPLKGAPGKRAKYRAGRQPQPRAAATGKLSLEETLEILGANSLQIDKGRGELLNDSGIRRVSKGGAKGQRGSSLLSLIDRLTERFGNN
jgi:hypothetical protein